MIRVAINGYGRIGRVSHRVLLDRFSDQAIVVAINVSSSTDLKGWMYLLKYDSVYGILNRSIKYQVESIKYDGQLGSISIDENKVAVFSQKDPSVLPWKDLNVDVVIDCTGALVIDEKLRAHITAGAKKVVLSAPAKDELSTYVLSVSEAYKGEDIISNASCTTNCIAPVTKVLMDTFGIEKAMLTTIHAYTSDQKLLDGGHKDYRRARAAALNIVPTSTGATKAVIKAIPQLDKKFTGLAIRVPVSVGSLSDTTYLLTRDVTIEEVNGAFKKASESEIYKAILGVTEDPLVSSDIIGSSYSAIVDLSLTQVIGNMVKVISWYDNEWGYANRLVEEVILIGKSQ